MQANVFRYVLDCFKKCEQIIGLNAQLIENKPREFMMRPFS